MKVVVLAPMIEEYQYHLDLTVRYKGNDREMSLESLYQLSLRDYSIENVPWDLKHEADIPAAGYYLTGLLKSKGHDVFLTNSYKTGILDKMADFNPSVICLSTTMIVSINALSRIIDQIRKVMPDVFIVAGGVFTLKNYMAYKGMNYDSVKDLEDYNLFHSRFSKIGIDAYVTTQHGSSSLLLLLNEIEKGRKADLSRIPNLVLPDNNDGYIETKRVEEKVNYDEDFTLWDYIDEMPVRVPLRTSIGCPYRCSFCDFCILYPKIHLRSPESLKKELSVVNKRLGNKVSVVHVSDDNVFINPNRVEEISKVFESEKVSNWVGFMRASSINESNIEMVRRSGLLMGIFGIESGDVGQLQRMKKSLKIDDQKRGIEVLDAAGISVLMSFVIGFPGENQETIQNTANFMNNLNLSNSITSYHMYPLNIFPLSELGDPAFREKYSLTGNGYEWKHYTMDGKDAPAFGYELLKNVPEVPYHYYDESHFFNRGIFNLEERKKLFRLRHDLTINLIEKRSAEERKQLLQNMVRTMGFEAEKMTDTVADMFYVKEQEHFKIVRK